MSAFQSSGSGPGGVVMNAEFMAFVGDDASFAAIHAFAERQGFPPASVQMGKPDMFLQMLEQAVAPRFVIIDIDGQEDPVGLASRLASKSGPECKLVAVGMANDVGLYRRMIAAGMTDYLVKPLNAEMIAQAYMATLRGTGGANAREAKIIVLLGVRGGSGATTIAVNTGWLLAHKLKFQVALFDLDLQFGTSALALDLEPGRGLRDMVASPQRVDSLMVASSMVAASDQFSVLGAEESVDDVVPVDSSAVTALLKEMKTNFDYIIVDLPRHLLASQKRLLAMAHEIILISELSLAGIRDTLRIKNALSTLGTTTTLTVVTSRVSASHPGQVDQAVFEKGSQTKVGFSIPDDTKSVTQAANTGKALGAVTPDAHITKALHALAAHIGGKTAEAAAAKSGLLRKIWGPSAAAAKAKDKAAKDKP